MIHPLRSVVLGTLLLIQASIVAAVPVAEGRFDYQVSWNGIPAGSASIEISKGMVAHRVVAAARTNQFVDVLWRFRAHATSNLGPDDLVPLGFRYEREENRTSTVTDVVFDRKLLRITGTRRRRGESSVQVVDETNVWDPISAAFHALSQPVHIGDTLRYQLFTGEARYRVELSIVGEETVTVPAGKFDTWRVEPRVWKVGIGEDRRLQHATIWVSRSPARAIVRIRGEVFIGAVNCDLRQIHATQMIRARDPL